MTRILSFSGSYAKRIFEIVSAFPLRTKDGLVSWLFLGVASGSLKPVFFGETSVLIFFSSFLIIGVASDLFSVY